MITILRAALLLIATTFSSLAISTTKIIQPDPSFQMAVVDGWELIDAESMMIFNGMSGRSGRQFYNIGIKRVKSRHTFDYPYMLVQIKNDGKHPTTEELKAARRGSSFDFLDVKTYKNLIKNVFYYDQFQNSIFMIFEKRDYDGSPLHAFEISHLTKNGRISVICYYKKSDVMKYIGNMGFMAATILIDDAYKYNQSAIEAPPRPK